MTTLYDIHTHTLFNYTACNNDRCDVKQVLNTLPTQVQETPSDNSSIKYSCGVHPWFSNDWEDQFAILQDISKNTSIVAIGECGFDKLKGLPMDVQIEVFMQHVYLSEKIGKPLIIHCVRAWDKIVSIYKDVKPTQPWILHGFRGKPMLARQLVDMGFRFSIGAIFNQKSILEIPINSLFCETDDSGGSIIDVYDNVATALNLSVDVLADNICANVKEVFCSI